MLSHTAYVGEIATLRVRLDQYPLFKDVNTFAAVEYLVATAAGETASFTKTLGDGVASSDSNKKQFDITLAAADTEDLSAFPHYCQLSATGASGSQEIVDTGTLNLITPS